MIGWSLWDGVRAGEAEARASRLLSPRGEPDVCGLQPAGEPSLEPSGAGTPISDVPAFRAVKKTVLSWISLLVYGILLWQSELRPALSVAPPDHGAPRVSSPMKAAGRPPDAQHGNLHIHAPSTHSASLRNGHGHVTLLFPWPQHLACYY